MLSAEFVSDCIRFAKSYEESQNCADEDTISPARATISSTFSSPDLDGDATSNATSYTSDAHSVSIAEAQSYYSGIHSAPTLLSELARSGLRPADQRPSVVGRRDSDSEPCLLVVKSGNAISTTIGRANGVFSIVRHYALDMFIHQTSMQWAIINYDSKSEVFSEPSDSGSIIADIRGRIGGMLTGGSGKTTTASDITGGSSSVSRPTGSPMPTSTSSLRHFNTDSDIEDRFSPL